MKARDVCDTAIYCSQITDLVHFDKYNLHATSICHKQHDSVWSKALVNRLIQRLVNKTKGDK